MSQARLLRDLLTVPRTVRYASDHRCQVADLHLPRGNGPHPVVVVVHGGSWRTGYGRIVMRPIAAALARRGFAAWNIEYRRIGRGQGGGWPTTFVDVAAAVDALATVRAPLDLARTTMFGHSAGGQLALWAAGRATLPGGAPGGSPIVEPVAAISAAGVNDLAQSCREVPHGAVATLMGGDPDALPDRYAVADPMAHLPLGVPVLLVHGTDDTTVSVRRSRNYAEAARARGATVDLVELTGEAGRHRAHVAPGGASFAAVTGWLESLRVPPAAVGVPSRRPGATENGH